MQKVEQSPSPQDIVNPNENTTCFENLPDIFFAAFNGLRKRTESRCSACVSSVGKPPERFLFFWRTVHSWVTSEISGKSDGMMMRMWRFLRITNHNCYPSRLRKYLLSVTARDATNTTLTCIVNKRDFYCLIMLVFTAWEAMSLNFKLSVRNGQKTGGTTYGFPFVDLLFMYGWHASSNSTNPKKSLLPEFLTHDSEQWGHISKRDTILPLRKLPYGGFGFVDHQ